MTVNRAPGTAAPCASVMVPNREAVSRAWENAGPGRIIRKETQKKNSNVFENMEPPFRTASVVLRTISFIDCAAAGVKKKKSIPRIEHEQPGHRIDALCTGIVVNCGDFVGFTRFHAVTSGVGIDFHGSAGIALARAFPDWLP